MAKIAYRWIVVSAVAVATTFTLAWATSASQRLVAPAFAGLQRQV